ncbi:hypothetical protein [Aeromicrobium sp. 179-A 4D2 NHS]|uniref:hypothetical protein n=1 Tax=Aeromicrobium sp. 179-A 4D2 NHS TaxID=3142375 RepID=UPI0039A2AE25
MGLRQQEDPAERRRSRRGREGTVGEHRPSDRDTVNPSFAAFAEEVVDPAYPHHMGKDTVARQKAAGTEGRFGELGRPEPVKDMDVDEFDYDPSGPVVHDFPANLLTVAEHAIEKANRRAERAGITERFEYDVERYERTYTKDGIERVEERVKLALVTPALRHDDWEFIAKVKWDPEAGPTVHTADGAALRERPDLQRCDICHSDRPRNDTFVIERDGEQLQVGGDCVKRFFGIRPQGLWMLGYDLEAHMPDDEGGYSRGADRTQREQTMALTVAVVEELGWLPRSRAGYAGKEATADIVHALLYSPRDFEKTAEKRALKGRIFARMEDAEDKAEKVIEFVTDPDNNDGSEYFENLAAVVNAPSVSSRNLGIFASAVSAYDRTQTRKAEVAAKAHSEFIGVEGKKVADVPVKVTNVRYLDGDYGIRTLVEMTDPKGNVVKWFASGRKEFETGQSFTLAATVKKHEEYQSVKQTVVTRAKLAPVDAP